MSESEARAQSLEFLRGLTDEDLASFFYEAMQTRNRLKKHDDGDFWNDVYVIAIATHVRGEAAESLILATAHENSYPLSLESKRAGPLLEGKCDVCQTLVTSTSKVAKCPVCSAEVGCT